MSIGKKGIKIFVFAFMIAVVLGNLGAQEYASTKRMGIFIGSNNGGRGRVMLRYAVSDARAVSRVFSEMGGIAEGDYIVLVEPTVAEINRRIDAMGRDLSSAGRNSQRTELVFYYSGHSDEDGLMLGRERYSYRTLRERINSLDTDMKIVILDSCSSGAITRAKGGVMAPPFLFDSSVSVGGYAFLTSSSADEVSQESDTIESSYFTHSILAGLRGAADMVGDGRVTLNELYRFAYTETLAMTETSMYGAQHPSYDIQISGSGDVVLTDVNQTSASILIDGEITGRISVRDENDFLVAELTKVNPRPMELGLSPGLYRITIQRGDNFYRAELILQENSRTSLTMGNFSQIASVSGNRNRGKEESSSPVIYSFFVNIVPERYRFPLIGFMNISRGDQLLPQFGFVNWNTGNFSSLQAGFVNTAAGDTHGAQLGLVNTTMAFYGVQAGLVNTAVRGGAGAQLGFVNISAQKLRGVQFGFINYADSIENGIPIGFLSIVREGGYRAVEYSVSEFHLVNMGLKLGVEKFYSNIFVAFDPIDAGANGFAMKNFALGLGFGSIIRISNIFFFNPEINSMSAIDKNNQQFTTLVPYFGIQLNKNFSITAAPSVTWTYVNRGAELSQTPYYKILFEHGINDHHSLVIGARAAVRLQF